MSERVCCVVVSPKTESISAIALAAMANTTMSWSVKSTVSISASNWNFIRSDNNRVGGPQVPVELGTLETKAFGGVGPGPPGSSIQRMSLCGVAAGRVVTPPRRDLFFRRTRATTAACERSSDIQERDWNARDGPKADIRSWLERCASSTGTAFVSLYLFIGSFLG